jgi:hypothetical protein
MTAGQLLMIGIYWTVLGSLAYIAIRKEHAVIGQLKAMFRLDERSQSRQCLSRVDSGTKLVRYWYRTFVLIMALGYAIVPIVAVITTSSGN